MCMMVKLIFHFLCVTSLILPTASRSWSGTYCVCATSNVNIRSGPGLSYPILGVLKTSTCLEYDLFSSTPSWYGVLYNHQSAWVAAKWTKHTCNSNTNQCVCAKSNVNIRSGPGLHHSIVGSMNIGACQRAGQEIMTGYGNWTSVKYEGWEAYIASEFLARRDCSRVPQPVNGNCVCARSNVNIRSGPALYFRILGVLSTGSCQSAGQEISTGNGRWTSVGYNGQSAYIASQFLYRQSCSQPNPRPSGQCTCGLTNVKVQTSPDLSSIVLGTLQLHTKITGNCVCARSNVNIRSGPALSYRILGVLYTGSCQGAGQEISTGNGRWTSVSYNGQSAYIASQFLYRQSCSQPNPRPSGQCACGLTNVKVQSSPSLSSNALGTLQSGGCLPYIGQLNGQGYSRWVIVKVDFTNAYIPANHVTRGPCSPSAKTRWLD